jgi:uncharacterized protein
MVLTIADLRNAGLAGLPAGVPVPTVPTDRQIRALHQRYAPTAAAFDLVYTHCRIVCAVAEQLLGEHLPGVDAELVLARRYRHPLT